MIRFDWIEDRRRDLIWYVGSPLLGLVVAGLALAGDRLLLDASGNARYNLDLGGAPVPVTSAMILISGWALLLDGPHFWPTLARTMLDPGEWRRRGGTLARSFLLFLLGPAIVLAPALAFRAGPLARSGPYLLLVVFVAWAYFHTARQHWGFFRLYKRRSGDFGTEVDRVDFLAFHVALFTPPLLFLTSSGAGTLAGVMRPLGTRLPLLAVHRSLWALYILALAAYAGWIVARARTGPVSGPKLLLLGALAPLHLVPYLHPSLPLFAPAIVGIGHDLQYQRIVWRFGRRKYVGTEGEDAPWSRWAFRSVATYVVVGLVFTLVLLRGPWVEWVAATIGPAVSRSLGAPLIASCFMGWLFQHYWLDARIWRFGTDAEVRRHLAG